MSRQDPWNDPWGGQYPPGGISWNDPLMWSWLYSPNLGGGNVVNQGQVQTQPMQTPPFIPNNGNIPLGQGITLKDIIEWGLGTIPGVGNVNPSGGDQQQQSQNSLSLNSLLPWLLFGSSLGSNLYSMIAGGKAAKEAAEIQSKSATEAANLQRQTAQDALGLQERMWQGAREDQEPWLNTGRSSLATLSNLMGLPSHGPETEYGPHTTGNLNMPFGNRPPMRNVGRGATPAAAITSRRPFMAARRRIG